MCGRLREEPAGPGAAGLGCTVVGGEQPQVDKVTPRGGGHTGAGAVQRGKVRALCRWWEFGSHWRCGVPWGLGNATRGVEVPEVPPDDTLGPLGSASAGGVPVSVGGQELLRIKTPVQEAVKSVTGRGGSTGLCAAGPQESVSGGNHGRLGPWGLWAEDAGSRDGLGWGCG